MNKVVLTKESKAALSANKEFTDKWVAGLRSGKYTQIRHSMVVHDVPNSACCLMVMEMECNGRSREGFPVAGLPSDLAKPYTLTSVPDCLLLPEDIQAEVWTEDGWQTATMFKPAEWNDILELSFEQIATLLETGELEYEH